jgi:hypothetical protein
LNAPGFADSEVSTGVDTDATAAQLGVDVLPTSGTVHGFDADFRYTVVWDQTKSLDRTRPGNSTVFTGKVTWVDLPGWVVAGDSVSRKVSVAVPENPNAVWVDGADPVFVQGSDVVPIWRIDKELGMFTGLFLGEERLQPDQAYHLTEGSTVVNLHPDYLNTLAPGVYRLKATFIDGTTAETDFTIKTASTSPDTPNKPGDTPGASGSDGSGSATPDTGSGSADQSTLKPGLPQTGMPSRQAPILLALLLLATVGSLLGIETFSKRTRKTLNRRL